MRQVFFGLSVLAICLLPMSSARADISGFGTQAFADIGTPTANTGNINTSTTFMLGDLVTTINNTGVFAGMPIQTFGSFTFVIPRTTNEVLTLSNQVFGTFTSASITEPIDSPGFVNILVDGLWSPGTFANSLGVTGGPFDAELRVAFTQSPASTGIISASATFSVVPEPSSIVLSLTSLAGVVTYRLRRRWRAHRAVA